jgi:hypothetical protein
MDIESPKKWWERFENTLTLVIPVEAGIQGF